MKTTQCSSDMSLNSAGVLGDVCLRGAGWMCFERDLDAMMQGEVEISSAKALRRHRRTSAHVPPRCEILVRDIVTLAVRINNQRDIAETETTSCGPGLGR